jgi:pyruvate, water dikinase
MQNNSQILWLDDLEIDIHDHSKSEMKKLAALTQAKFPIIPAFIITDNAYFRFLKENNLDQKVSQLLQTIAVERPESLMQGEHHIWQLFKKATLSEDFIQELKIFYHTLGKGDVTIILLETNDEEKKHITKHAHDLDTLTDHILSSWAEMFTSKAIWHRHHNKHDQVKAPATILIQKRITGNAAGTIITVDPESHEKDKMVISTHHPNERDIYTLSKKNLSIIDRKLRHATKHSKLTHEEILAITKMAKRVENFLYFPQEIGWILDENKLYITSVKPFSLLPKTRTEPKRKLPVARGKGITPMIGTGYVHIISTQKELQTLKPHDAVILKTNIKLFSLSYLKNVRSLIFESIPDERETMVEISKLGLPVVHVKNATKHFKNGYLITIHGGKGEIYNGGFL